MAISLDGFAGLLGLPAFLGLPRGLSSEFSLLLGGLGGLGDPVLEPVGVEPGLLIGDPILELIGEPIGEPIGEALRELNAE